ncbi:MAG: hypothetical protein OXD41_03730, partial [Thaumarchaeota archaeon]|nr:hypothetical protein [Nitrososphaerota archaeon]
MATTPNAVGAGQSAAATYAAGMYVASARSDSLTRTVVEFGDAQQYWRGPIFSSDWSVYEHVNGVPVNREVTGLAVGDPSEITSGTENWPPPPNPLESTFDLGEDERHVVLYHEPLSSTAPVAEVRYDAGERPARLRTADSASAFAAFAGEGSATYAPATSAPHPRSADRIPPTASAIFTSSTEILVTFSEAVTRVTLVDDGAGSWMVDAPPSADDKVGVSAAVYGDTGTTVRLTVSDAPVGTHTIRTPAGLADLSGNAAPAKISAENLPPSLGSAETRSPGRTVVVLASAVTGATAARDWTVTFGPHATFDTLGVASGDVDTVARDTDAELATRVTMSNEDKITILHEAISTAATPTVTYSPAGTDRLIAAGDRELPDGAETVATDGTPPEVRHAMLVDTDSEAMPADMLADRAEVAFTEPITPSEDTSDYTLYALQSGGEASSAISAVRPPGTADGIRFSVLVLDLVTPVPHGTYWLEASVSDRADPANAYDGGRISASIDTQAPMLVSAEFVGTRELLLTFDEALDGTAARLASSYALTLPDGDDDGTDPDPVEIAGADYVDGALTATLRLAVDAVHQGVYTATPAAALTDAAGVGFADGASADATYTRRITAETSSRTTTVITFVGAATATISASSFTVNDGTEEAVSLEVTGVTGAGSGAPAPSPKYSLSGENSIVVAHAATPSTTSTPRITYTAPAGGLPLGSFGLALPANSVWIANATDGAPPEPESATISAVGSRISVTFGEAVVASGTDGSTGAVIEIERADRPGSFAQLRSVPATAVSASGSVITVALDPPLKSGTYRVTLSPVYDAGGSSGAASIGLPALDSTAPEIASARTTGLTTTLVTFDELVEGRIRVDDWSISVGSRPGLDEREVTHVTLPSGASITNFNAFALRQFMLLHELIEPDDTPFVTYVQPDSVAPGSVKLQNVNSIPLESHPIPSSVGSESYNGQPAPRATDGIRPVVTSISFADLSSLVVRFSERVDRSSAAPGDWTLTPRGATTSTHTITSVGYLDASGMPTTARTSALRLGISPAAPTGSSFTLTVPAAVADLAAEPNTLGRAMPFDVSTATTPPTFEAITYAAAAAPRAGVVIVFSEPVTGTVDASHWTITAGARHTPASLHAGITADEVTRLDVARVLALTLPSSVEGPLALPPQVRFSPPDPPTLVSTLTGLPVAAGRIAATIDNAAPTFNATRISNFETALHFSEPVTWLVDQASAASRTPSKEPASTTCNQNPDAAWICRAILFDGRLPVVQTDVLAHGFQGYNPYITNLHMSHFPTPISPESPTANMPGYDYHWTNNDDVNLDAGGNPTFPRMRDLAGNVLPDTTVTARNDVTPVTQIASARTTGLTTTVVEFASPLARGDTSAARWSVTTGTGASTATHDVTSVRAGAHDGPAATPSATLTVSSPTRAITLVHEPFADTGAIPSITYTAGITPAAGDIAAEGMQPVRKRGAQNPIHATDSTAPTFTATVTTGAASPSVTLTFSEPVSLAAGRPLPAAGDWSVTPSGAPEPVALAGEAVTWSPAAPTADAPATSVEISLPASLAGTALGAVSFSPAAGSPADGSLVDAAGLAVARLGSAVPADTGAPRLLAATLVSQSVIRATFSEDIALTLSAFDAGDWSSPATSFTGATASGRDVTLIVSRTQPSSAVAAGATLAYSGDSVTDTAAAPNAASSASPPAPLVDMAPPQIHRSSYDTGTDTLTVTFTEPILFLSTLRDCAPMQPRTECLAAPSASDLTLRDSGGAVVAQATGSPRLTTSPAGVATSVLTAGIVPAGGASRVPDGTYALHSEAGIVDALETNVFVSRITFSEGISVGSVPVIESARLVSPTEVRVAFSEGVTATFAAGDWSTTDPSITFTGAQDDGSEVALSFSRSPPSTAIASGATLSYSGNARMAVRDFGGAAAPDTAVPVPISDAAPPRVVAASAITSDVRASESDMSVAFTETIASSHPGGDLSLRNAAGDTVATQSASDAARAYRPPGGAAGSGLAFEVILAGGAARLRDGAYSLHSATGILDAAGNAHVPRATAGEGVVLETRPLPMSARLVSATEARMVFSEGVTVTFDAADWSSTDPSITITGARAVGDEVAVSITRPGGPTSVAAGTRLAYVDANDNGERVEDTGGSPAISTGGISGQAGLLMADAAPPLAVSATAVDEDTVEVTFTEAMSAPPAGALSLRNLGAVTARAVGTPSLFTPTGAEANSAIRFDVVPAAGTQSIRDGTHYFHATAALTDAAGVEYAARVTPAERLTRDQPPSFTASFEGPRTIVLVASEALDAATVTAAALPVTVPDGDDEGNAADPVALAGAPLAPVRYAASDPPRITLTLAAPAAAGVTHTITPATSITDAGSQAMPYGGLPVRATHAGAAPPFSASTRSLTETVIEFGASLSGGTAASSWAVIGDDPDGDGAGLPPALAVSSVEALGPSGAALPAASIDAASGVTRLLLTHAAMASAAGTPDVAHSRPAEDLPAGPLSSGGAAVPDSIVEASDGFVPAVSVSTAAVRAITVEFGEPVSAAALDGSGEPVTTPVLDSSAHPVRLPVPAGDWSW